MKKPVNSKSFSFNLVISILLLCLCCAQNLCAQELNSEARNRNTNYNHAAQERSHKTPQIKNDLAKEKLENKIKLQLQNLVQKQRSRKGWLGDGSIPENVKALRDLSYANSENQSQKLDLYLPESKHPLALVIWIHGGGWRSGDKKAGPIRPLLEAGYAVASVNYRLSQEAKWPAQIEDCIEASNWLVSNHEKYGLDPERIGLWGASAGGHLALMEAMYQGAGKNKDTAIKQKPLRIKAVCDWFGPCDLLSYLNDENSPASGQNMIEGLLGEKGNKLTELAFAASPASLVDSVTKLPAIIIFHGNRDRLVPLKQSESFVKMLKSKGISNIELKVVNGGHGFPGFDKRTIDESIMFFQKELKQKQAARE